MHAHRQYKRYKAHAGCFHQPDGLRHALLLQIVSRVKNKERPAKRLLTELFTLDGVCVCKISGDKIL